MAVLERRLGTHELTELLPYLERLPAEAEPQGSSEADPSAPKVAPQQSNAVRVTANPLMLSMVASLFELRRGGDQQMPETVTELYGVAAMAMLERAGSHHSSEMQQLLEVTFFEAHARQKRLIDVSHLEAAALEIADPAALSRIRANIPAEHRRERFDRAYAETRRMQRWTAQQAQVQEVRAVLGALHTESIGVVCARVGQDRLPLLSLLEAVPLSVQSSHLSFQEYFTAKAICEGRRLPQEALPWRWSSWWANVLRFGQEIDGLMTPEQREALRLNPIGFTHGLHKAAGLGTRLELGGQLLSATRKSIDLAISDSAAASGGNGAPTQTYTSPEQPPPSLAAVVKLMCSGCTYDQVDLSENRLTCAEVLHLAKQMRHEGCHVVTLNLSSNRFGPRGACAIADLLTTSPKLVDLNLHNCNLTFAGTYFVREWSDINEKWYASARNGIYDGSAVLKLAKALPLSSLTSLDLGSNELCGVDCLDSKYATECFEQLVTALEKSFVTSLSLRRNSIGDRGAVAIGQALGRTRLRRLDLWGNQIGVLGAQALANAISGSQLVDLNLCGTWLRLPELRGAEPIKRHGRRRGDADFTNKAVKVASLSVITKCIQGNTGLRSLTLRKLWLGDAGAVAIAAAIPECLILEMLDCGVNCITSIGARALAAALPRCSRLVALDLCHNVIDDRGVASLCEQLPASPLLRLVISSNSVDVAQHVEVICGGLNASKLEYLKYARTPVPHAARPCAPWPCAYAPTAALCHTLTVCVSSCVRSCGAHAQSLGQLDPCERQWHEGA